MATHSETPPSGTIQRWSDSIARRLDGTPGAVLKPHVALLVPALLGAIVLALLTWIAGETYDAVTEGDGIAMLDQPALNSAIAMRSSGLNWIVTAFTTIGGPIATPIIAAIIVVILCLHWRSLLPATLMVAATIGSLVVTIVGKNYVGRVRPDHAFAVPPYEFSPSFPSGHSLNSVVVSGVLAYLLLRRLKRPAARIAVVAAAVLYSLLMGLSRVYLGHHWLTDVITGWALGLAWLGVVIAAHQVALAIKRRSQPEQPGLEPPAAQPPLGAPAG